MSVTTVFSVWRFPTDVGAQRVVHSLARVAGGRRPIEDAAVVSWPAQRPRPLAWQALDLAGDQPFAGAFWGMLVSLLFLLPLSRRTDEQTPENAEQPSWSERDLVRLGFDAPLAAVVRSQITVGTSALMLFHGNTDSTPLTSAMPPQAREIVRRLVDDDQLHGLHAAFDG